MSTKYRREVAAKLATVLGIAGLACGALMPAQAGQEQNGQWLDEPTLQRVAAGYAATPVGVDLKDKDPVQVGLGSYIVNTTGICNHCHSSNQFYKAGFPLTTPDPSGQKGNPYFLSKSQGGISRAGKDQTAERRSSSIRRRSWPAVSSSALPAPPPSPPRT